MSYPNFRLLECFPGGRRSPATPAQASATDSCGFQVSGVEQAEPGNYLQTLHGLPSWLRAHGLLQAHFWQVVGVVQACHGPATGIRRHASLLHTVLLIPRTRQFGRPTLVILLLRAGEGCVLGGHCRRTLAAAAGRWGAGVQARAAHCAHRWRRGEAAGICGAGGGGGGGRAPGQQRGTAGARWGGRWRIRRLTSGTARIGAVLFQKNHHKTITNKCQSVQISR